MISEQRKHVFWFALSSDLRQKLCIHVHFVILSHSCPFPGHQSFGDFSIFKVNKKQAHTLCQFESVPNDQPTDQRTDRVTDHWSVTIVQFRATSRAEKNSQSLEDT